MFLEGLQKRANKVNTNDVMRSVVIGNSNEATRLNSDEQLDKKRVDRTGRKIIPRYHSSNKKTGHPNLKDTGQYHRSFKVLAAPTAFEITAHRQVKGFDLAAHLIKRYGEVLGLTQASMKKYVRFIKKDFTREFKKVF